MDTTKAREGLSWRPKKDARATLQETVEAARDQGLVS
jgi:nucleoside-diphosphate-sugar epimerase